MRCPDCNKFVSYDREEPEVESMDVDSDGTVHATVRLALNCAECGTALKSASLDFTIDPSEELTKHLADESDAHSLEVEDNDVENYDRVEGKGRGARTFYGATLRATVTCDCRDGEPVTFEVEASEDVQASAMDEEV